ncbi:hypothetical protein [Halalkalibacter oceani]|uniref:Transposase n=1 Tax=Halalkalibacter oceani TaxID=1653776 RepID=A0A9X2ISK9_9BACI|nr:hypothetical protein [Halalkalibacter oceani]MCM3716663.1 hypothetical protein [Halalkalibacter oceani]
MRKTNGATSKTQRRYEINIEQWEQIKHMFPPYQTGRPTKLSNRTMFNAFLLDRSKRCGMARFAGRTLSLMENAYSRFCKWRDSGLLIAIFQALHIEPDFENLSIDSTSIKAHQDSAGAKKTQMDMK